MKLIGTMSCCSTPLACPCPNPEGLPLTLDDVTSNHPTPETTPAPGGAGGRNLDQERVTRCLETTELLAGLDVNVRLYKRLVSLRIVTVMIEAEANKIIRERLSGPTGHYLILRDKDRNLQCKTETELETQESGEETKCWRDEALVRKLLRIRLKELKAQEKRV